MSAKPGTGLDLSSLDGFRVSELVDRTHASGALTSRGGQPLQLPLVDVEEDPTQPRGGDNPGFSPDSIHELASSIRQSGVKSPISVRPRNEAGKYVINHGARRFRAAKQAGLAAIPAFVDQAHDQYDQVIENIQRENLTPMEIARFIEQREKAGDTRSRIAARLGKSNAYITQHAALLTLPDTIQRVYDDGRCRDVSVLYKLGRIYAKDPVRVANFLDSKGAINRTDLESLRAAATLGPPSTPVGQGAPRQPEDKAVPQIGPQTARVEIAVTYQGRFATLRPDLPPSSPNRGFIEDTTVANERIEVPLAEVHLKAILHR